jgi:hypothetical protein
MEVDSPPRRRVTHSRQGSGEQLEPELEPGLELEGTRHAERVEPAPSGPVGKDSSTSLAPTGKGDHPHPARSHRGLYLDVHQVVRPSPLSKESAKSQNYRGFFNLAMLLLAVLNLRLILENYIK